MAGRDEESQAIVGAAMHYVKTGDSSSLEPFTLAALKKADYQLGDRDFESGYRRAIKDQINQRESYNENEADVVDLKPNFFGLGINLNESWHRVKKWWTK